MVVNGEKIKSAIEILASYFIQEELNKRNIQPLYKFKDIPDQFSTEISSLLIFLSEEENAIICLNRFSKIKTYISQWLKAILP